MVRKAERDKERVGHWARAEDRREHDVAGKPGEPRKQGVAADGENASEHAPLLAQVEGLQNREVSPC